MKMFELNGRRRKNGRRPFKVVLHEIYPDDCIQDRVGNSYNSNGICWIESYCENNLDTIHGMSLTCEFADVEEQDILLGHGDTGFDGDLPIFDNATIVGNFDKGYIEDVEIDGIVKRCVVGEGTIDQMRCNKFVKYLEDQITNNHPLHGSVEIAACAGKDHIEYLNGKVENGRIPTVFDYSGYSLLGIRPADNAAVLVELNQSESEDGVQMNEELKTFLQELMAKVTEIASCKKELEEANVVNAQLGEEKSALSASVQQIQNALDDAQKECKELGEKYDRLWNEHAALEKMLAEAQARERVGELNAALKAFTDEQIAYAKDEKDAFEKDPAHSEINAVIDKIYLEIGKRAAEDRVKAEQNADQSQEKDADDIFSEINSDDKQTDNDNIF